MRSNVGEFHLETARHLDQALATLRQGAGALSVIAGGTDVMVLFEAGMLKPRKWLSINGIAELKEIRVAPDAIEIGALATYTDIFHHPVLRAEFPNLGSAARETGGLAIQNRGTLGGNIANASPAADSPPALLGYGAELKIVSSQGARRVAYDSFHLGYKKIDLKPGELIHSVRLPRGGDAMRHFYRKVGTRRAQAISKVVLAATCRQAGGKLSNVRVALGSVAPTTVRCAKTEAVLEGQSLTPALAQAAVAALMRDIAPIDDIRSTADYRNRVAGNVLASFLAELA